MNDRNEIEIRIAIGSSEMTERFWIVWWLVGIISLSATGADGSGGSGSGGGAGSNLSPGFNIRPLSIFTGHCNASIARGATIWKPTPATVEVFFPKVVSLLGCILFYNGE